MEREKFILKIGRSEVNDLYPDLEEIELEIDDRLAAELRLVIRLLQDSAGNWPTIADLDISLWEDVKFSVIFGSDSTDLFEGVVTHVRTKFEKGRGALEVRAMDRSILLDRRDVVHAWKKQKDSAIAATILRRHGLRPRVADTKLVHSEIVSTIMQRETDMRFLRRLAERNGFECYVEGRVAYFRNPRESPPRLPAVYYGGDGKHPPGLGRFEAECDALRFAPVVLTQLDRLDRTKILKSRPFKSGARLLGKKSAAKSQRGAGKSPLLMPAGNPTTGLAEMNTLVDATAGRSEWFVQAEGEIISRVYKSALLPRRIITVAGVGKDFSGEYYLTRVTHKLKRGGPYTQIFRAERNAIGVSGLERWQ